MKKKRLITVGVVAALLISLAIAYLLTRPNVTITGHGSLWETNLKSILLTPLTEEQLADIRTRFTAAKRDPGAASELLAFYRSNAWPSPAIPAPRTGENKFSCKAPDGPAVATFVDEKEGFIYFKFDRIQGATIFDMDDGDEIGLRQR